MLIFIDEYIKTQLKYFTAKQLSNKLKVSKPMITIYKKGRYNPSLEVAKQVYLYDKIALHPYSEESLLYELMKDGYTKEEVENYESKYSTPAHLRMGK